MDKMIIEVNYRIVPSENSWTEHKIKSNIADDGEVSWKISKSLSDELIKKSGQLKPEQLLIEYAEMQKRELEFTIQGLSDLELTIKSKTDTISIMLDSVLKNQQLVFEEKHQSISNEINIFTDKVSDTVKTLNEISRPVDQLMGKLNELNGWKFKEFFEVVQSIQKLHEKNPSLLKFITENFKINNNE